uniref:Endo-1,4-beta-xylanase n=1 Tax=uncultured bacterium contig00043 TaxID=1181530 RepID=A0A806JZI0_9BACT|nr:xylanase [uncultured bacterium contig00043]
MGRKFGIITVIIIMSMSAFLAGSCAEDPVVIDSSQWADVDPATQTAPLDPDMNGVRKYSGNSSGNQSLPGSPYGYEIYVESGKNIKTNLMWYGPNQGGGAAFKADWSASERANFIARIGYFWGNGKKYTSYNDLFCGFNFTRSANGTAGGWSYIGIYGWSRNPLVEYYIVEDWYGNGIIGPNTMGGGAAKIGELEADGATYFIYKGKRYNQPSIDGTQTFDQFFSVRQTRRQSGTISITEHFKKWEELGMNLGNLYEAKFKVEVGGGTGWFDSTFITLYQKD